MKEQIFKIIFNLAADIVFGLVASIFAYFVLGSILPDMLSTSLSLGNGAIKLDFLIDKEIMKSIFSIWHNFCILFGIRFIVAYICGIYTSIKNKGE